MNKFDFFCPHARYRGEPIPQHQDFNFHFQYFVNRVSLICNLQTGGKIPPTDAYFQVVQLWQEFQETVAPMLDHLDSGQPILERPSLHSHLEIEEV